jgi:hypothetical protein
MNIGKEIDKLVTKREAMRALQKEIDAIKHEFDADSLLIMEEMEQQGMQKATGMLGTISLKDTLIAHVIDWDRVYNYILRNKAFHLMQKRISDGAFRELLESRKGKSIPGIDKFNKKGINLRIT